MSRTLTPNAFARSRSISTFSSGLLNFRLRSTTEKVESACAASMNFGITSRSCLKSGAWITYCTGSPANLPPPMVAS